MSTLVHTNVDTAQLNTTITNIESSLKVAENAFDTLGDLLTGELLPTWSGDASSVFFQIYNQDAATFKEFTALLRRVNDRLREAAGIYDNAEADAVDMVSRIRV